MYRPQFAYKTPDGCRDDDFTYGFDGSNVILLNQDISGKTIPNIPLPLDQDAPFLWRGIKVGLREEIQTGGPPPVLSFLYEFPDVNIQFEDPYQNKLSDGLVPATHYGFPMQPIQVNNSLLTGSPVPQEPEIYCPPGSTIYLSIQAPVLGVLVTDLYFFIVTLYGVKRFKECG